MVPALFIATVLTIIKIYQAPTAFSNPIEKFVTVSVGIGEPVLALYGYASPLARVELTASPNVRVETQSQENGYFHFAGVFINQNTKELCLTAFDRVNRSTLPVCISTPALNFRGTIGPVILPPSLSLSKGNFLNGETIMGSGESLPNSQITVSLYKADKTKWLNIIKSALAFELPKYTIKTDQNGNFSFNLPSNYSNTFRLLTQVDYDGHSSPLSHKLSFRVYGWFEYLWEKIKLLLSLGFKQILALPIIEVLIVFETVILFMLARRKKKTNTLMIVRKEIIPYLAESDPDPLG